MKVLDAFGLYLQQGILGDVTFTTTPENNQHSDTCFSDGVSGHFSPCLALP